MFFSRNLKDLLGWILAMTPPWCGKFQNGTKHVKIRNPTQSKNYTNLPLAIFSLQHSGLQTWLNECFILLNERCKKEMIECCMNQDWLFPVMNVLNVVRKKLHALNYLIQLLYLLLMYWTSLKNALFGTNFNYTFSTSLYLNIKIIKPI